ncbi:MAG: kinase/pyrophosphorylase [Planctomycetota bacterium]
MKKAKRSTKRKKAVATRHASRQIHVLTDGTGGLPRHLLTAVLTQFPGIDEQPLYHVFCTTPDSTAVAFKKHVRKNSIVFYSFVDAESKRILESLAAKRNVACFDLTGPAVDFLAEQTGQRPIADLDRVHTKDAAYFDRIDAWEFTMQHDDSRRLESVGESDLILVGISRVSKSPTSAYLGWLGLRVSNISFDPRIGLPKEVRTFRKKCVALTIAPKQLSEIRNRRLEVNGFADVIAHNTEVSFKYAGLKDTIQEVMQAESLYQKLKIPMVDVTHSTIEEIAAKIMQIVESGMRARKTR